MFKLIEFDYDALNNNPSMKNWINMLFQYFKIPTSIPLDFFHDKTYLLNNT